MWELMAIQEPAKTVASLIDIGYLDVPASALRVTRARRFDWDVQQNERDVFQCYVFGPKKAGKSAFLNYFLGRTRTVSGSYTSTSTERFAVNVVDLYRGSKKTQGSKKTLVLREIPEKKVKNVLSNENCFAACDIAIFAYDSSDKRSWERTKELFAQVAGYSEKNSFGVPCYFLYSKEDPHDSSSSVGPYMNITLGRVHDIFLKIVNAAECPQQTIPGINGNTKSNDYHGIVEPLSDCSVPSLLLSKMDENQKARTRSRKRMWAYR